MKNGRPKKMTALGDVLAEVLKARGLTSGFSLSRVAKAWEGAVGTAVARHASPDRLTAGRLGVVVDSSAWMQQLSMLSPRIIEKLNRALGTQEVSELRFRIGSPQTGAADARGGSEKTYRPRRRPATESELADAKEAASNISDPETREQALRLLISSCTTKKGTSKGGG